jgi:hypothetical protein
VVALPRPSDRSRIVVVRLPYGGEQDLIRLANRG